LSLLDALPISLRQPLIGRDRKRKCASSHTRQMPRYGKAVADAAFPAHGEHLPITSRHWNELINTFPRETAKSSIACPSDRIAAGKVETRVYFSPFIWIVMQQHLGISVVTRPGFK